MTKRFGSRLRSNLSYCRSFVKVILIFLGLYFFYHLDYCNVSSSLNIYQCKKNFEFMDINNYTIGLTMKQHGSTISGSFCCNSGLASLTFQTLRGLYSNSSNHINQIEDKENRCRNFYSYSMPITSHSKIISSKVVCNDKSELTRDLIQFPSKNELTYWSDRGVNHLISRRNIGNFIEKKENNISCLHILLPGFSKALTGGPLSILHFANEMVSYGMCVNLLFQFIEGGRTTFLTWIQKYKNFDNIHLIDVYDFNIDVIPVTKRDIFMATLYRTAYTIHHSQKKINSKKFIYFIQDFEPLFYPHGTEWLEAENSYLFDYFPIYSTTLLREYFHTYRNDKRDSYVALPAVPQNENSIVKHHKRLIFYGRPNDFRNSYDYCILALQLLIDSGELDGWSILSVGSKIDSIYLSDRVKVTVLPNVIESEYFKHIESSDVALSLMVSPHPSLPPLDFVSSGCVTVTNTFWNKDEKYFNNLSHLIIPVEPNIESIVSGLKIAIEKSFDLSFRNQFPRLNWPTEWNDDRVYGPSLFKKVKNMLDSDN